MSWTHQVLCFYEYTLLRRPSVKQTETKRETLTKESDIHEHTKRELSIDQIVHSYYNEWLRHSVSMYGPELILHMIIMWHMSLAYKHMWCSVLLTASRQRLVMFALLNMVNCVPTPVWGSCLTQPCVRPGLISTCSTRGQHGTGQHHNTHRLIHHVWGPPHRAQVT